MVKGRIKNSPVFCPFLTIMIYNPIGEQLPNAATLWFAKVAKLIRQHLFD